MRESAPRQKAYIDERLFERIRSGEQDAFRELYDISYKPLYAFLLSHTLNSEDAKDLLQDTYIQIFQNCHTYRTQGNPMAWMMKIAKNLFLMKCRKEKEAQIDFEEVENELGFDGISNLENRMVLSKMFALLSKEDRDLIILHDLSGLKHREIAAMYQMPLGTVIARYNRSIRKLRKEFGERL